MHGLESRYNTSIGENPPCYALFGIEQYAHCIYYDNIHNTVLIIPRYYSNYTQGRNHINALNVIAQVILKYIK